MTSPATSASRLTSGFRFSSPKTVQSAARETRPLFIKPRDSQSFFRKTGRKGVRARNRRELVDGVQRLTDAGHRLVVQEYVPGPASNHYFVDGFAVEGGEIAAHLVRRRLRWHSARP